MLHSFFWLVLFIVACRDFSVSAFRLGSMMKKGHFFKGVLAADESSSSLMRRYAAFSSLGHKTEEEGTSITSLPDLYPGAPASLPTVVESAFALIPPDHVWEPLQRARVEQRDMGVLRWPPHANVLYPFVPPKHFETLAPLLAEALSDLEPFTVTLSKFESFDRKDSSVLYLVPEVTSGSPNSFELLYEKVSKVCPYCANTSNRRAFVPHLTVTHTTGAEATAVAREALEEWWEPVSFEINQLHCMSRHGPNNPYELRWRVFLGGGHGGSSGVENGGGGGGSGKQGNQGQQSALAPATEVTDTEPPNNSSRKGSEGTRGAEEGPRIGGASCEKVELPYPHMVTPEQVDWVANTRRELMQRRKRGQRRKHRNSSAGK